MIKKKVLAILVVLMMFVLAGCIKSTTSLTVNTDGSGSVKMIIAMLKEYAEQGGLEQAFGSMTEEYQNDGYTVADYSDGKYTGYQFTKDFTNIKDVSTNNLSGLNNITISDTEPRVLTINSTLDTTSQMESQGYDLSQLQSMGDLEMTFELTLPNAPTTHNATEVNGNTLKWDLLQTQTIQVEATLTGGGSTSWLLIGGIIGGVLLVAIVVLVIVLSSRKKKAARGPEQYVQQYQPPQQPVQPQAAPEPAPEPVPEPQPQPEKPALDSDIERHIRETMEKYK